MPDLPDPFELFDLASQPAIMAAVSGGSDSTALLLLLKRHLDGIGLGARLVAVTVDHGLRPDSAGEARAVALLCDTLGVRHRVLTWTGAKPATGLPAAARAARYTLLSEEAQRLGATVVLTGHTADDQAETVAMRQARRGDRGLAGMASATLFRERLWILRPLLGLGRRDLRSLLRAEGIGWFDDPTNANLKHERARLRASLEEGEAASLLARATLAARNRTAAGIEAAALVSASTGLVAPGLVRLTPGFSSGADRDAATYALRMLLASIGGTSHLPDAGRAGALVEAMARPGLRATLSRCVVESRRDGVYLRREQRALPPPRRATPGDVWDGRFILEGSEGGEAPRIAVASETGPPSSAMTGMESSVPDRLALAAARTLPRLFDADGESPADPKWALRPILAPWRDFLPGFDLAPARSLATLLGAERPPAPPLRQHNVTPA